MPILTQPSPFIPAQHLGSRARWSCYGADERSDDLAITSDYCHIMTHFWPSFSFLTNSLTTAFKLFWFIEGFMVNSMTGRCTYPVAAKQGSHPITLLQIGLMVTMRHFFWIQETWWWSLKPVSYTLVSSVPRSFFFLKLRKSEKECWYL